MALYELVLEMDVFGVQTINRWNYVSTGTPAVVSGSFALVSAFGAIYDNTAIPPGYPPDTPLAAIMGMLPSSIGPVQITALNVYDPVDFYQTPFAVVYAGALSGTVLSPLDSYGFRTNVVRRDIRRGTKRFSGVIAAAVEAGGSFTSAALTRMNLVAERMTETLSYVDEGNTLSFAPAVVSKEEYDPNPTEPDANHRAYKYYSTLAAQLSHTALGIVWTPYNQIRSQTSRQYGRGQ